MPQDRGARLRGVSPQVKEMARNACQYFASPEGQREMEDFFQRMEHDKSYRAKRHCRDPFCPFCSDLYGHKPFVATI